MPGMTPTIIALARDSEHCFSKQPAQSLTLLVGLGIEGDAHAGRLVQHLSRMAKAPNTPNLRQVHLLRRQAYARPRKPLVVFSPKAMLRLRGATSPVEDFVTGKFEPVLDALLEQQPGWAVHGSPEMAVAWEIAGAAGLDLEKAETDQFFPGITGILNQDAADVEALAIRQTPTFFLNGKRLENFSADSLIADVRFAVENS